MLDLVSVETEISQELILSKSRSIEDEAHMAKMVKDIIDDADCPGGCIFRKWLSECDETGTLIDWDEIL